VGLSHLALAAPRLSPKVVKLDHYPAFDFHIASAAKRHPLDPILFILDIDPLHRLLQVATDMGLLSKLNERTSRFRVSMYADDTAIFLKPFVADVNNLKAILLNFGTITGLQTNLQKTSGTSISCNGIDLDSILADFPVSQATFPIKCLGLPLTLRQLKKLDFQTLIDKAAGKMSAWNGRNQAQAGRVCLTKSVLSSQPVYHLTVLKPPLEVMQELDKIKRHFLSAGDKAISGGKCKVKWTKTTLLKELGGLGVLDLEKFMRVLHLRWL
jgi:hypothetical protein